MSMARGYKQQGFTNLFLCYRFVALLVVLAEEEEELADLFLIF